MRIFFLQLTLTGFLWAINTSSVALTDTYFATGDDLDYIIESDSTTPLLEFEYKLRRFMVFRKIEDYFINIFFDDSVDD